MSKPFLEVSDAQLIPQPPFHPAGFAVEITLGVTMVASEPAAMTPFEAAERDRYIAKARASALLDAAVLLIYYNARVRCGPHPQPPRLEIDSVFPELPREEALHAQESAWGMWSQASAVGLAYFHYPGASRSHEEERALLVEKHPGFSNDSYERAVSEAIFALR